MIINIFLTIIIMISLSAIMAGNPVNSVIGLILIFIISALYFIILGINYIAFLYLIIYVGAIAILFLFVVMMMNLKYTLVLWSESSNTKKILHTIPLTAFIISLLLTQYDGLNIIDYHSFSCYSSSLPTWSIILHNYLSGPIVPIAKILYSNYILLFITFSFLLLLAMVGPIVLFIV